MVVSALVASVATSLPAQTQAVASTPESRRGGVCYEVFVRSFYDRDGDGIGGLRGLIQELDPINDGDPGTRRDLGASCIRLMPLERYILELSRSDASTSTPDGTASSEGSRASR